MMTRSTFSKTLAGKRGSMKKRGKMPKAMPELKLGLPKKTPASPFGSGGIFSARGKLGIFSQ